MSDSDPDTGSAPPSAPPAAEKPSSKPAPKPRESTSGESSDRSSDSPSSERRERRSRRRRGSRRRPRHGGSEDSENHRGNGGEEGHDNGGNRRRKRNNRKPRKEVPLGPPEAAEGLFEMSPKGFGFIRNRERDYQQTPGDIFVTPELVREHGLRQGLWINGIAQEGARGLQLTSIEKINGGPPAKYLHLPAFEELKAVNPNKRILLETDPKRYTTRIVDMMAPIGRGQRGLIVAPPRTGKTTLLQHMAEAVVENQPEMHLIVLLIDERPEEVTDFRRTLPDAEIFASSNDSDTKTHVRMAQLCIDRAKRLVEAGEQVFVLMDSITRLARAFNNAARGGGRTGSGGLDTRALEVPRRIFASARNTREGGSLTIVATALIETGSRMDEVIYQEFKGTGNMELVLDRHISNNYVYPAVDIFKSGTRREELLLPPHQLQKIFVIRRGLSGHKPIEAIERLLTFCERFPNNAQMLLEIPG